MSSNMYGFTCNFMWEGRWCFAQIVYEGTSEDSWETYERATADWETQDPVLLAKYELEHRDWSKDMHNEVRISAHGVYPGWLDTDPPNDPTWHPPQPAEREVLLIIADGAAVNIEHGWDT